MPKFNRVRIAACGLMALCTPLMTGALGFRADLNDRILAAHNREREGAGVAPLHWDGELARGAGEWAGHLSRTGRFAHSPNIPGRPWEGENIWGGTSSAYSPEAMVARWVSEKRDFVPGIFPYNSRTGRVESVSHYTQIMWRRTRAVGCAVSTNFSEEILVCRYSEAGNIIGQKAF